eukprot:scaffold62936_cov69-Phaeocystis_antarctica.AAC.5
MANTQGVAETRRCAGHAAVNRASRQARHERLLGRVPRRTKMKRPWCLHEETTGSFFAFVPSSVLGPRAADVALLLRLQRTG